MSRSVTTPTNWLVASTIGISPQLLCTISAATSSRVVAGEQHAGFGVITSRASLAIYVPPQRRILNVVRTASVLQQTIHYADEVPRFAERRRYNAGPGGRC